MNKTKVTTRKGSKTKTKKQSPEVFVLPPNLLEKLGINLGHYGSASGSTTNSQITDVNLNSKDNTPCKNKPAFKKDVTHVTTSSETRSTSIIETAELMKKSVFLSPTFISNNTSVIQGEIEIVGNVAAEGVDGSALLINNEYSVEKTEEVSVDMHKEYVSLYNIPNPISSPISSSTQENKQCDPIIANEKNIELNELEMQTLIDDHADEAYSSDCSNSNIVCTVKSDVNKCNENKINIISEQIILPSQFYELKSNFSPQESSLIHVPINTMAKSQCKNNIQDDDSNAGFNPFVAGAIEPAEVAIVNECDMYEQNCIKDDDVTMGNIELLQTISNIDQCTVLNASESEFVITTQNKADFRQDLEKLQMQHIQHVIIKDPAAIDPANVVPCHIDFVDENNLTAKENETFSASTNRCPERDVNEVLEYVEVNVGSSINKQKDDNIITKTMSTEDKSDMLMDRNNLISCSIEAENEFQNSLVDSHMKTGLQSKCSPADSYPNMEIFDSKEEINSPEKKYAEEFSTLQNGEADLIHRDKNISVTDYQQSLQSVSENVSKVVDECGQRSRAIRKKSDVNKTNSSRDISLINFCKQDKNTLVQDTPTKSPILYIKHYKKQVCEKYEFVNSKNDGHENNELHECNKVKVDHISKTASHEDKVREIAKYLSEFAELRKTKDLIQMKNTSSKTLCNKKNATDSKSSIQGVEKPGGSGINKNNSNYPPTKTYQRRGRRGCKTILSCQLKEPKTSTQAIDMADSNSTNNICNEMEVCLCYDFGQLMSYDNVSSYEHIHFWNNARIDCTPDVIFSIYSEEAPVVDIDSYIQTIQRDVEECPSKICDVSPYKLCWNEMKHISENGFDNSGMRKNISSSVDIKEAKNNEDNEQQEVKRERLVKSTMVTVNSLENCEGVASNKNPLDVPAAKTGQKREHSTIHADNDEPPAKNKKQGIPKQLSQNKLGNACIKEEQIYTNCIKNVPVRSSTLESPSSLPVEDTSPGEHQTQAPENETKNLVSPSKSINKAEKTLLSTQNENGTIICGVCQLSVEGDWIDHIALKHDYLAWKSGEPPLDVGDKVAVREHLNEITKASGRLTCSKCGLARKYVKAYLTHVRRCHSEEKANSSSNVRTSEESAECVKNEDLPVDADLVKCAVCDESMHDADWNDHRATRHDYLAWKQGEPVFDVNDETAVREYLYEVAKTCGGLTCAKCGLTRKHVRAYLSHTRSCAGLSANSSSNVRTSEESAECVKNEDLPVDADLVKCAVCDESMHDADWNDHRATRHDYLAWKQGEPVLDVNDETAVREHLCEIAKTCGGLTCAKCGLTRKHVRAYLSHTRSCAGLSESQNDSAYNVSSKVIPKKESDLPCEAVDENLTDANAGSITCGVCEESVQVDDWYHHIGSRHDYLAWKQGNTTLDVNDQEAVRTHLYEITKARGGLTCAKCGLTRKYVKAYLSHIKTCIGLNESQNDSTYNVSTVSSDEAKLADKSSNAGIVNKTIAANNSSVECAVCKESMLIKDWHSHASQHDYLAWKVGDTAMDVTDDAAVKEHLYEIAKACGGLTCAKCGLTRKYVKGYLTHIKSCDGLNKSQNDSSCNIKTEEVSEKESVEPTNDTDTNVCKQEDGLTNAALIKCGVCEETVQEEDWYSHIGSRHNYLAWKFGETTLDINDDTAVKEHLNKITSACGELTCSTCGLTRKHVKAYLTHFNSCSGVNEDKINEGNSEELKIDEANSFKCGVCNEVVISLHWEKHLSDKHEYLAWKDGETPLNVDVEEDVHQHLYKFTKQFGCLYCKYCGKNRKYVKSFLEHIKACKNGGVSVVVRASTSLDFDDTVDFASGGTCGVCQKEVEAGKWIQHTQKEHNYLAWREGERPWNVDDFEDVNQYLYVICKRMDGLTCNKCGLVRKYVKSYLTHIKNCDVTDFNFDSSVAEGIGPSNKDEHQCAMCNEVVKSEDWKEHAIEKHYNVTWIVGETPIDIKNVYAVERFLKEYKRVKGRLNCNSCGTSRTSFAGFYAHIIVCKKTEAEIDMYRTMCDICNNKYLCIYKNQHALMHRVQVLTAENKIKLEEKKETNLSGKRRAAMKARSVIENYSDNMSKHSHSCQSCGFGTDFEEELKTHKCEVSNEKDFSGDEDSAAEIGSSENESGDTDVDSNISNEVNDDLDDEEGDEETQTKKKRYRDPAPVVSKVSRIPFKVEDVNSYVRKGDEDFCNIHLTDEVLFPGWQCQHEPVLESELTRYLPPLERSCKLRSGSNWTTLDRFKAKADNNGTCIFVGASIACVAWVPPRVENMPDGGCNFLAIACHNGPDCPRYLGGETAKHENLIQIWNFGKFRELPKLVFGIAHDFGTVWSIAWCPSGARDVAPDKNAPPTRLGLLAVACSSGSVYIFAVPYPSTVVKNKQVIHKLKPVAELRMTMGLERKSYQATSVSWSKQKKHKLILVGYADGSTAYYDLHSDSPLLSTVENGVQVLYPYYDERPHSTCITGTDLYPVSGDAAVSDVGAWTAPTGAELAPRAGTGAPGRVRAPTASLGVAFAPHACAAVLAGDDAIMQASISELVWVPPGRRLGGTRCAAGCARCGRVACSMPPTLRLMRLHPSYSDCNKQVIGMLEMTHLAKKRKKKVNDELSMTIEPLTYDEAVSKYGIEFTRISRTDRPMQQQCSAKPKTHCPERFPLADVESMAFCPSRRFHDKLAVATHSGILFLMNTS